MIPVDFSRHWRILAQYSSSDRVASLAAAELCQILKQVTGHDIPVVLETLTGMSVIRLWHDAGEMDCFDWQSGRDAIDLHGHNARGLLYAVYDFLEALGCRWIAPGDGPVTLIPSAVRFEVLGGKIPETPALPGRCLIIGHYAFMQQVEEWIVWAARNRCFAHATDDSVCPVNAPHYSDTFRGQIRHFRAAGASPVRVFEYYLDAVLFNSVLPPLLNVLQHDLRFYREAGVHTIQALTTGDHPWVSAQFNAWCYTRLVWNPDQDLESLLANFYQMVFGKGDDHMPAYYRLLEQAFRLALELDPQQIRLVDDVRGMWENPSTDMGDPAFAPPEVLKRKSQQNTAILDLVSQAAGHLEAARIVANPDNWQAERVNFELIQHWLRFDYHRLRLYETTCLAKEASFKEAEAYQWLKQAQTDLDAVLAWGSKYLKEGSYRANFRLIHWVMWGIRLNWIRFEHFTSKLDQWLIKIRCLARAGFLLLKVRFAYI